MKPRVLVFCDYYLPGYKSGGGMRTVVNTVDRLGDEFDFRIVTRNYDGRADRTPYKTVKTNEWNKVGKGQVFYVARRNITPSSIASLVNQVNPRVIYSNSYFSTFSVFLVFMRKVKFIDRRIPLVIAPEGEFLKEALKLKRLKKMLYIKIAQLLGLYNNVIWKVTSEMEKEATLPFVGKNATVMIAPNMPPKELFPEFCLESKPRKETGKVKVAFLGRIHPTKNLKFFIEIAKDFEGITLDIYGPTSDKTYAEECLRKAAKSKAMISFKGEVRNDQVPKVLSNYHFFVAPTLGESFGHVMVEALAAGCPLVISDRTPWRNLQQKGIGWDISLDDSVRWKQALSYCLNMDDTSYKEMSRRARSFIENWLADDSVERATREVFLKAIEMSLTKQI